VEENLTETKKNPEERSGGTAVAIKPMIWL
jgi:hypothetical protein